MIEPRQLLTEIIRPVLKQLDLWSEPAERLVLGTACQESECGRLLRQTSGGPALGIYQMEPETEFDILLWLDSHVGIKHTVNSFSSGNTECPALIGNLYYATAMCRIKYLRDPEPIPDYLAAQAEYWKRVYNTPLGAGTPDEYRANWNRFVTPSVLV